MSEDMNLSINGQSKVPPGFRFHPTEEELLHYYLRKKVAYEKIDLDVIREVDLNKLEPWDIQEKCRIGTTPQNDWYFFSHKDKKYPTGTRTNRATAAGFWKATGRDKIIYSGFKRIGLRKTLVFYKGRAPHGQKSDWIMHEYRLDESDQEPTAMVSAGGDVIPEEGWVVCRVFKKKNYQKTLDSPRSTSPAMSMDSKLQMLRAAQGNNNGVLDQILSYMGRTTCKLENDPHNNNLDHQDNNNNSSSNLSNVLHHERLFMHLPRLDSPTIQSSLPAYDHYQDQFDEIIMETGAAATSSSDQQLGNGNNLDQAGTVSDWVALDRLVASQLNGQADIESSRQFGCFGHSLDDNDHEELQFSQIRLSRGRNQCLSTFGTENDLWSNFIAKSASSSPADPLSHLSV